MFTLIVGGAASGKSGYAESLILRAGGMPRTYIAAMEPFDDESRARIARHRAMRAGKGFETVECYRGLEDVRLPRGGAVLLEDVGNLTANELYGPGGAGEDTVKAVLRGVDALRAQCGELVVVSNDVFSGGADYAGDTERYLRMLGLIDCALAARADNVAELVCGIPVYHKGKEPYP